MFFAFIKPDQLIDFHLKWLNWASVPGENLPSIYSYNPADKDTVESFKNIIQDIEGSVSVKKMKILYTYYQENKYHFDE